MGRRWFLMTAADVCLLPGLRVCCIVSDLIVIMVQKKRKMACCMVSSTVRHHVHAVATITTIGYIIIRIIISQIAASDHVLKHQLERSPQVTLYLRGLEVLARKSGLLLYR